MNANLIVSSLIENDENDLNLLHSVEKVTGPDKGPDKAAELLASTDELIKLHTQKLELLKQYRIGLVQRFQKTGQLPPTAPEPKRKPRPRWEVTSW